MKTTTNKVKTMTMILALMLVFIGAQAQNPYLNETFNTNPNLSQWTVDRYAPAAFVSDNSLGTNVLKIGIAASDGAQLRPSGLGSTFYNTQGRGYDQTGLNVKSLKGSLYLPADWATNHRRSDMWAVGMDATNSVSSYAIMGFRNIDGSSPTFSYWDDGSGWVSFATPTVYDTWYNFEIRIVGANVEYYMNNNLVGTISAYGSVTIGNVIMQAYNFNDNTLGSLYDGNSATNSYDAYWDNVMTQSTVYNVTQATYSASIQAALDASNANDVIHVYPGNYDETAAGKTVVTTAGPQGTYQFGLFFDPAKPGVSVIGVDASGNPITNPANCLATVTTNATNDFGTSGIFVNADNITIQGLKIGDNASGDNKTIEVIGNNITIKCCWIAVDDGGDIYINDWSYNAGSSTSTLTGFTIDNNLFANACDISIASGAGYSGAVSGRKIINNTFDGSGCSYLPVYWPAISFNGTTSFIGWFNNPVGGAIITGNTFSGYPSYIRNRGTADQTQFDWQSYWNNNTFDKAVITLSTLSPFTSRSFTYSPDGTNYYQDVHRIGTVIQDDIDNVAVAGDVVMVGKGTYNENININKGLKLYGHNYNISPNTGTRVSESILSTTSGNTLSINTTSAVEVKGFEIINSNGNCISATVDGTQTISKNYFNNTEGIYLPNSVSVTMDDNLCKFNNNANDGVELFGNYDGTTGTYATLHDNTFVNDISTGPMSGFNLSNVNGVIYNNTFNNIGYYAILVANYSSLDIHNNLFSGIVNPGGSVTWGSGVRFYTPTLGMVTNIHNNVFTNNNIGVAVRDNGAPSVNITGYNILVNNNSFGGNTNSIYNQASAGTLSATCNWYGSNILTTVATSTFGNINYIPYLSVDGTYPASGFSPADGSCTGTCNSVVFITETDNSVISNDAVICSGSSATLDAGLHVGYLWSPGGATTQSIVVSPTVTTTYTVTVTDGNGCSATATQTITVNTVPTPSITGTATACATVSLTASGGSSYLWSGGNSTSTATNTFTTIGTNTYTVNVTNACGTSSASQSVTVNPVPVGTSSSITICNNANVNLDLGASMPSGTTFTWTAAVTAGSIFGENDCYTSMCGSVIGDLLANLGSSNGVVRYTITPLSSAGCQGLSYTADVTVRSSPVLGAVSGPSAVCGLTSAVYSVSPMSGATGYTWTVPTGVNGMTILSGQGTTSINVSISASFYPADVSVVASTTCENSNSSVLSIVRKPATPGIVSGPVSTCGLSTAAYSIFPVLGATSYSWIVPSGMTIISGATTSAITVSIGSSFVAGNVGATAINSCGTISGPYLNITGKVPGVPGTLSGPTNVCGFTTASYSIPAVAYATGYTWMVPPWMTITSGAGTTSITVSATGTPAAGTVSVAATNVCGTGTARSVTLTLASVLPGAISGTANICGQTTATYSIVSLGSGYTYTWVLAMSGWTITSGQGSTTINISGPAVGTASSGLIKVSSTNLCGNISGLRTLGISYCHSSIFNDNPVENTTSSLYPNPTTGEIKLDVTSGLDEEMTLQVYDVLGNLIISEKHKVVSGTSTLTANLENNKAGLYFVRLLDSNAGSVYSQTVIKN